MAVEVVEASRVHEAEILGPVHFGATRSERSRADLIDRFTRLDAEAEQRQRVCVRASAIGSFENSANLSRLSSMMKACSPTSMQAAESSLKAGLKLTRSFAKNAMLRRTSTTGRFTNRVRPGCDQGAQVHSREDLRSKVHDDVVDQDQKRTAAIIRSWRTRDVATHPSPGKSSARSCSLEPSVSMVNAGARHVVLLSLMGVNRAMPTGRSNKTCAPAAFHGPFCGPRSSHRTWAAHTDTTSAPTTESASHQAAAEPASSTLATSPILAGAACGRCARRLRQLASQRAVSIVDTHEPDDR